MCLRVSDVLGYDLCNDLLLSQFAFILIAHCLDRFDDILWDTGILHSVIEPRIDSVQLWDRWEDFFHREIDLENLFAELGERGT